MTGNKSAHAQPETDVATYGLDGLYLKGGYLPGDRRAAVRARPLRNRNSTPYKSSGAGAQKARGQTVRENSKISY